MNVAGHTNRLTARGCWVPSIALAIAMLAGCGSTAGGPSISATRTARATETAQAVRAAEPVVVDVTSSERGTISQHNVTLAIAIRVTNQTIAPITIFHQWCQPPIVITVRDPSANGVWYATGLDINGCLLAGNRDLPPAIAASHSNTWNYVADLGPSRTPTPGATYITRNGTYTVLVRLTWHQGTLAQAEANHSLPSGEADGSGSVTIPS